MSIPSDPSKPSPIPAQPISPSNPSPPPSPGTTSLSNIDPTGVWTKFLSASGTPATPEQVKAFIQGILKTFNLLIQQQQKAAARAHERMKKVIEGEE